MSLLVLFFLFFSPGGECVCARASTPIGWTWPIRDPLLAMANAKEVLTRSATAMRDGRSHQIKTNKRSEKKWRENAPRMTTMTTTMMRRRREHNNNNKIAITETSTSTFPFAITLPIQSPMYSYIPMPFMLYTHAITIGRHRIMFSATQKSRCSARLSMVWFDINSQK